MKKLLGLFFVVIIGTVTSASAQSSSALNYNTPRKYEVAEN